MDFWKLNKHGNIKLNQHGNIKLGLKQSLKNDEKTGSGFMNMKSFGDSINRVGELPAPVYKTVEKPTTNYKRATMSNGLKTNHETTNLRALGNLKLRNKKLNNLSFEL